jgi:hypothetical protein
MEPTKLPSMEPSKLPTMVPSPKPSGVPIPAPTPRPTAHPSITPIPTTRFLGVEGKASAATVFTGYSSAAEFDENAQTAFKLAAAASMSYVESSSMINITDVSMLSSRRRTLLRERHLLATTGSLKVSFFLSGAVPHITSVTEFSSMIKEQIKDAFNSTDGSSFYQRFVYFAAIYNVSLANITYDVAATANYLESISVTVSGTGVSTGFPSPLPTAAPSLMPSPAPTTTPAPTVSAMPTADLGLVDDDLSAASMGIGIAIGVLFSNGIGLSVYLYMKKREKALRKKAMQSRHQFKFTDDDNFVLSNQIFEEKKPRKGAKASSSGTEETKEDPNASGDARFFDRLKPYKAFRAGQSITTPGGTNKTVGGGDGLSMAKLAGLSLDTGEPITEGDEKDDEEGESRSNRSGLPPPPPQIRRTAAAGGYPGGEEVAQQSMQRALPLPPIDLRRVVDSSSPPRSRSSSPQRSLQRSPQRSPQRSAAAAAAMAAEEDGVVASLPVAGSALLGSAEADLTSPETAAATETSEVSSISASPAQRPRDMVAPAMPPPPGLSRFGSGPGRSLPPPRRVNAANMDNSVSTVGGGTTVGTEQSQAVRTIRGRERRTPGVASSGPRGPGSRLRGPPPREPPPSVAAQKLPVVQAAPSGEAQVPAALSVPAPAPVGIPGVPRRAVSAQKRNPSSWIEERRIDINGDGDPLTRSEFEERYGDSTAEWDSSPVKR